MEECLCHDPALIPFSGRTRLGDYTAIFAGPPALASAYRRVSVPIEAGSGSTSPRRPKQTPRVLTVMLLRRTDYVPAPKRDAFLCVRSFSESGGWL